MPSLSSISLDTPEWLDAPERPRFARGEIHLWRANLDNPHLRVLATETLSARDAIRAGQHCDEREREREFAAAAFARAVLSRYIGASPAELRIEHDPHGAQRIALCTLNFASARAENFALLAVAAFGEVHIEIESVHENIPHDEMAEHFFEPREQWDVRTAWQPEQKSARFFDIWTRTEAALKSRGAGHVHRFCPAQGFAAAVVTPGGEPVFEFWHWR